MAGFEALCFCDAWKIGMGSLFAVAGPAKDLQVLRCICATHSEGQNVVNVPRLASVDLLRAGVACAFPLQE
jgi:hypothetical protein